MNNAGVTNFTGMMFILCLTLKYFFFIVKSLPNCMYNDNNR